jgi:pimeloyl-ACP methyl ester carboxylesterase
MAPKLVGPDTAAHRPEVLEEVRRIGAAQSSAGVIGAIQMLRDRPDAGPVLDTIAVPTLILVGRDDALTPLARSERLAQRIKGSRLVVIEKAGHLSNLEQPAAFNAAVREFLQGLA